MFATDTRSLERALRANPWIATAEVHRELPRTMVATIVEHQPAALVDLGALYLVDASGKPFKRAALEVGEGAEMPVITGIERLAFRANPNATIRLIHASLRAAELWRAVASRPAIDELRIDDFGGLALRTHQPALTVHLGALDDLKLAERMRMFEAAWAQLTNDERARTETLYLDAGLTQATIAFAKN
jgi:cell division septal protein FtsQ